MKNTSTARIIGRVAASIVVSAAIVLVLLVTYSWWHAAGQHYPEWARETFRDKFLQCLAIMSLNVYLQLAVVFVASLGLALFRRKHNMLVGLLAGPSIMVFDFVLPCAVLINKLEGLVAQRCAWLCGIPLLVTALQLIRKPEKRKASNQSLQSPF